MDSEALTPGGDAMGARGTVRGRTQVKPPQKRMTSGDVVTY